MFDTLTYCGESLFGWSVSEDDLLKMLDREGTERAVVVSPKPVDYRFEASNTALAWLVERHPDRLLGFVRVDPWQHDAVQEVARGLGELGLRGLFLHPWEETFRVNMPSIDELVGIAASHRVPVMIATGFPWLSEALQVGDLARRFPETPFILTTGGQINISGLGQTDAELATEANANIYLQTTGVYREDFIQGIAERLGSNRLLYASGYPQFDPRLERLRVEWAPALSAEAKAQMLGGNADALFAVAGGGGAT
jgi:predicted TIM-barrel fold metal-dependent hydrolase